MWSSGKDKKIEELTLALEKAELKANKERKRRKKAEKELQSVEGEEVPEETDILNLGQLPPEVVQRALGHLDTDDLRANDNYVLRMACKSGSVDLVRLLFDIGLTADDLRADDNYALRMAIQREDLDVARFIISKGATLRGIEQDVRIDPFGFMGNRFARSTSDVLFTLLKKGRLDALKLLYEEDAIDENPTGFRKRLVYEARYIVVPPHIRHWMDSLKD